MDRLLEVCQVDVYHDAGIPLNDHSLDNSLNRLINNTCIYIPQPYVNICVNCNALPNVISFVIQGHIPRITLLYNIGYGISLFTLLIAVFIMLYFK